MLVSNCYLLSCASCKVLTHTKLLEENWDFRTCLYKAGKNQVGRKISELKAFLIYRSCNVEVSTCFGMKVANCSNGANTGDKSSKKIRKNQVYMGFCQKYQHLKRGMFTVEAERFKFILPLV